MSLNKAILYGKEHRIQYGTKSQPFCKAVDKTCRNHGGRSHGSANQCKWCLDNRTRKDSEKIKIKDKGIHQYLSKNSED